MVFGVEFMWYWVKNMGVDWFFVVVDQYGCIVVELDYVVIGMVDIFCCVYDDSFYYVVFFNVVLWNSFFDGDDDDVVYLGVFVFGVVEYFDVYDMMGVGVVGDVEVCLYLNYDWLFCFFIGVFLKGCLMFIGWSVVIE